MNFQINTAVKLLGLLLILFILLSCRQENKKYQYNIGYIDPKTALGDKEFTTCDDKIFEYYNSSPDGGYKYGKQALRDSVMNKYSFKCSDSGYLTFRFVVNCKGLAGRYQIVENSLDLKPTKFTKDLVSHLFSITQEFKEWRPVILDNKSRDFYIYISYKLRDGEIIEILP
jgi:hypothetical protein